MRHKTDDVLGTKTFKFSVRIVRLYQFLSSQKREFLISKQIFRSGTNPGAMVREAKFAESPRDFIHKLSIALKEIEETIYWLDLLFASEYISTDMKESLKSDAVEIAKLLTSSIKTKKKNMAK